MAVLPLTSSSLDLTISISIHPSSAGERGESRRMRDLDINKVPVPVPVDEEEEEDVDEDLRHPRKKLRLFKEQSLLLEESFRRNHTPNQKQKEELATQLKLKSRQVEVWFQNRRARSKLKQTEMELAYLKRWLGSLTERNRQLQREVEQLRAMKVEPLETGTCTNSSSASPALTMCPRCERFTTTTPATTTTTTSTAATCITNVILKE